MDVVGAVSNGGVTSVTLARAPLSSLTSTRSTGTSSSGVLRKLVATVALETSKSSAARAPAAEAASANQMAMIMRTLPDCTATWTLLTGTPRVVATFVAIASVTVPV
jgi:negative regulator of replication initiation